MGRAVKHAFLVPLAMTILGCVRTSTLPAAAYDYDLCDRVQRHPTDDNVDERVRCAKSEAQLLATSDH
jgi:hypothetical protein